MYLVLQRLPVAVSCLGFYLLASGWSIPGVIKTALLAILALLACIEKLASITNLVSVEKDWVVVIAGENEGALRGSFPPVLPSCPHPPFSRAITAQKVHLLIQSTQCSIRKCVVSTYFAN